LVDVAGTTAVGLSVDATVSPVGADGSRVESGAARRLECEDAAVAMVLEAVECSCALFRALTDIG